MSTTAEGKNKYRKYYLLSYYGAIFRDIERYRDLIPNKHGLEILIDMMKRACEDKIDSEEEKEYIRSIADQVFPYNYDCNIPYDKLCEALDVADKNGWRLKFALDVEFYSEEATEEYLRAHPDLPWYERRIVGSRRQQCDGWSSHIEFEK